LLATAGSVALFRTWLNSARLGLTDTSYHDMNQKAGTPKGMSSW